MTLEFSDKELDTLIELSYLGNWLSNSTRFPDKIIRKYDGFLKKIIKKICAEKKEEIYYDELYEKLERVIKHYDGNVLFSELSKQYADYVYPLKPSGLKDKEKAHRQFVSNSVLGRACEKTLKAQGMSVVNISLPDVRPEIERELSRCMTGTKKSWTNPV